VETRAPLDATHDLISFTVYDDQHQQTFESQPFRFPRGEGWVDPASATIDNGTVPPAGITTVLDPLGRVRAVRDAVQGSSAEPGIACDSLTGLWTSCVLYDTAGKASGDTTLYHVTRMIDATNHLVATFEDALGRTRSSQSYRSGRDITANILSQTATQYNVLNLPTPVTVTDLAPQTGQTTTTVTTTTTYDDLGQVITQTDPDRGPHTYTYDENGQVLVDSSGTRRMGTNYDLLGRVTDTCLLLVEPETDCWTVGQLLTRFSYDGIEEGYGAYNNGRLSTAESVNYYPGESEPTAQVSQFFRYDQRGQLVYDDLDIYGITFSDIEGTYGLESYTHTQSYNDADQPTTTQTFTTKPFYDPELAYTFTQVYESTSGGLIGLSDNSVSAANLATQSFDAHEQVENLSLLTQATASPFATTLTYDALDHLVQWDRPQTASQQRYLYDAFGQRVGQYDAISTRRLTTYPFGLEEYVYDPEGTRTKETHYYSLDGSLLGSVDGSAARQLYLSDGLGSVIVAFKEASGTVTVLGNQTYDPYGNYRYTKAYTYTNRGFTGQYEDGATGLDYYNARYYDPLVGRFTSADTVLGNPQGTDPYGYVEGNPETYTDPSGHLCYPLCTMAVGALTGGLWAGGASALSQGMTQGWGNIDWGQVGKDAGAGALGGAVAGLIPGAGCVAGAARGAADAGVSQFAGNAFNGRPLGQDALQSAVMGGITGGVMEGLFGGGGAGGCGNSFSAETVVATPNGEQTIGSLKEGDQILAFDPETKQPSQQTVEKVYINHDTDLLDVTLSTDDGT
jgi:RHS repeat-associated protein